MLVTLVQFSESRCDCIALFCSEARRSFLKDLVERADLFVRRRAADVSTTGQAIRVRHLHAVSIKDDDERLPGLGAAPLCQEGVGSGIFESPCVVSFLSVEFDENVGSVEYFAALWSAEDGFQPPAPPSAR